MPTIQSNIPVPEELTLPESLREFAALFLNYRAMPVIPMASVYIEDEEYPSGRTITEEDSSWEDVYICTHDQKPHVARKVTAALLNYYKPNLKHVGLCECMNCNAVRKIDAIKGDFCTTCSVQKLPAKNTPRNGWIVSKTGSRDVSPTFGFELELEAKRRGLAWNDPQSFAETIIREVADHPPMVSTTDGSLSHGCEMVSHPMTYDYIVKNNGVLSEMFTKLRKHFGAENESGEHRAALHIHADYKMFVSSPSSNLLTLLNSDWVEAHKDFLVSLSGRPESSFKKWCMAPNYQYIGPRNQHETWECRGFSNHAIFDHGTENGESFDASTDLPHICNWIKAIAWMTHDETRFGLSPIEIMSKSGHDESVEWLKYFPGADKQVPDLMYRQQKAEWTQKVTHYKRFLCGTLVRLRPGGVFARDSITGNPDTSRVGIAGALTDTMCSVNQTWNGLTAIFHVEANNLEIVEGRPYDRAVPSLVFTPVVNEVR